MAEGPSKYNDLCEEIMDRTNASAVMLVVVHGDRGSGMALNAIHPKLAMAIADTLEKLIPEIRRDVTNDLAKN